MNEIKLVEVTPQNFYEIIKLKVDDGQTNFVASNLYSIAQSKIYPTLTPLAVYAGNDLIGFTLSGRDTESDRFYVMRLMIDARFQGKGYGRGTMKKLIERLAENGDCREIYLSFVPDNRAAENLYLSLGFKPTGEVDQGETVMRLTLDKTPQN